MNISDNPVWRGVSPYKKPFHILRIQLARQYARLFPQDTFIGVTGSVGKTSCVQACQAILSQKFKTIATKPNLDPMFNIPITLLRLKPTIKRAVLEMGVEYKGDMDLYLWMVKPKIGIFTRLNFAHTEFLDNLEGVIDEKSKLISNLPKDGFAILNWDDINCKKIAQKTQSQVIYYGRDSKNCTVWASNIKIANFKTIFELNYGVERVQVNYQLLGEHQIYSALAAAALGVLNDISLVKIKRGLEQVTSFAHRLQPVQGPNGSIILDDTYNASPAAVEAAIDTLMQISARRRVLVLGEMRELGVHSENLHTQIAGKIYKEKIDLILLGQGETKYIYDELLKLGFLEEKIEYNLQNSQIVKRLLKFLGKGDVCLIKGSRAVRLDEVVERITKK